MQSLLAHVNIGMWKPQTTPEDYAKFMEFGAQVNHQTIGQSHLKWQFGTQLYNKK